MAPCWFFFFFFFYQMEYDMNWDCFWDREIGLSVSFFVIPALPLPSLHSPPPTQPMYQVDDTRTTLKHLTAEWQDRSSMSLWVTAWSSAWKCHSARFVYEHLSPWQHLLWKEPSRPAQHKLVDLECYLHQKAFHLNYWDDSPWRPDDQLNAGFGFCTIFFF